MVIEIHIKQLNVPYPDKLKSGIIERQEVKVLTIPVPNVIIMKWTLGSLPSSLVGQTS